MDYISYVKRFFTPELIIQVLLLVCVGILGIVLLRKSRRRARSWKNAMRNILIAGLCLVGIANVPRFYGQADKADQWDNFFDAASEYNRFVNANFDMELTGMYQYFARDLQIQVSRKEKETNPEDIKEIEAFFESKPDHVNNVMTGLFEGKNLIVVMMESTDDWLINEVDTPALHYMMKHGISFANMYTPGYSNGYTFNTEFAFNTSVYPYSNGNAAYTLANNSFHDSLANQLSKKGYEANSFHEGISAFYNRGEMHEVFGYQRYHSYNEYPDEGVTVLDDTYLIRSDLLYQDVTRGTPFYSFIITYGGHLPYDAQNDMHSQHALNMHPEYDVDFDREVSILKAKVRLTDDMFSGLLKRLDEDGLLEDTVIVGFADHYAYGLNKERLQELSEQAGSTIMERTPAFVFCAGYDEAITVDKTMQITDLAPTLMNLFGIEVPKEIMGQDIFDDNYRGIAIFPNYTWVMDGAYMKDGVLRQNEGYSNEEIMQIQNYVQQAYRINDLILDTDYYNNKMNKNR